MMSEEKCYASDPCHSRFLTWVNVKHGGAELGDVVVAQDYDALAAQRDEGLAREAELRDELALCVEQKDALSELVDQVLGLLRADKATHAQYAIIRHQGFPDDRPAFLDIASPGCADGEKP